MNKYIYIPRIAWHATLIIDNANMSLTTYVLTRARRRSLAVESCETGLI